MIITVHLAHHVSAAQETKVRELVEWIGLLDSTWEKAQFRIDRDDFTWISGRTDAAVDALLALVLDAIRSESSLAAVT